MKTFFKKLVIHYLNFWARLVVAERKPRIVGITGSVGKTTTKEAIAAVLTHKEARPVVGLVGKSEGNLNTEFGLPFAVLRYPEAPTNPLAWLGRLVTIPVVAVSYLTVRAYPQVLVLEYAADRPGDIERLVHLAQPSVACVTAVGPAHLERFKSVDRIAKEKGRLTLHVPPTGLVVLAKDNPYVAGMAKNTHAPIKFVRGRGITLARGMAEAVGRFFGLDDDLIRRALKNFRSLDGRLVTHTYKHLTVIDDTYNANPLSMELALDTLQEQAKPGARTVAFLGEMRELGEKAANYHAEIGAYARRRADVLVGVGPLAKQYKGSYWYQASTDAAREVDRIVDKGDVVLVKGSRGVQMEHVVHALIALAEGKAPPKERHGKH